MENKRFFRWERRDSSITRQADLQAVKQIMPAQDVGSDNHCGVAGDEWVVFMASGSFSREETKLEDDFSQKSGKSNRTQMLPLPHCYVRNGGRTGSPRVEWSTQRWEKSSLLAIHSFSLKWKFAQAEQDFFITAVLVIQRAEPAKCSSFQQRLETAINKMALVFLTALQSVKSLCIQAPSTPKGIWKTTLSFERT